MKNISRKSLLLAATVISVLAVSTAAYAFLGSSTSPRIPVAFFAGHSHLDGHTIGAPQHSGGTNALGCHNGSVPYHCH